jgi:hypothetical protein
MYCLVEQRVGDEYEGAICEAGAQETSNFNIQSNLSFSFSSMPINKSYMLDLSCQLS